MVVLILTKQMPARNLNSSDDEFNVVMRDWRPDEDDLILRSGFNGCADVAKRLKRSRLSVVMRWKKLTGHNTPKPTILDGVRAEIENNPKPISIEKQVFSFSHSTSATIINKKQLNKFLELFFGYCIENCGDCSGIDVKISFEVKGK